MAAEALVRENRADVAVVLWRLSGKPVAKAPERDREHQSDKGRLLHRGELKKRCLNSFKSSRWAFLGLVEKDRQLILLAQNIIRQCAAGLPFPAVTCGSSPARATMWEVLREMGSK